MVTMAFFIFANMEFICFNGDIVEKNKPVLFADNRSFKYGDGVFETILFLNGKIILEDYHFERLFNSLQFLQIKSSLLSQNDLKNNFLSLCQKNNLNTCRIRLTVYRDEDNNASYVIETNEVPLNVHEFNKEGWNINLYPFARKSIDAFSNLKSVCYQQFVMADKYAKENSWNESIVLNANNHICEGSKTNIFLFKNQQVYTPALHEGCVNGVMRRHVIEEIKKMGMPVKQTTIKEEDLFNAEEVFLTNSIQVIKWVKTYRETNFSSSFSKDLSKQIINNF
jgi:branched-chain amino acid aminotransferase